MGCCRMKMRSSQKLFLEDRQSELSVGKARPAKEASASLCTIRNYRISKLCAMGIEDQKEEREVLESIFPEEIIGSAVPSET